MKKKVFLGLGAAALGLASVALTGCSANNDVFHVYAWNTEFQGFFYKYVSDEKTTDLAAKVHLDGKEVKFTIVPSDNGAYQEALDKALANNSKASGADKVDLFLAEADYILKYTNSDKTKDVSKLAYTDSDGKVTKVSFADAYQYTVEAASDSKGVVKGASFQCCPAGVIYRRSIAKEVLGVEEPEDVQPLIDSWDKFNAVAAQMKAKDKYMVASFAETYRAFSNNVTKPWVDANNNLQYDDQITAWMDQAEDYVKKGYTPSTCPGIWDDECTKQMFKDGKTFCYFGPAWYYNFCMGNAQDKEKGCFGDWGLVEGPAPYFWGGTWMLAATDGDDDNLVAKTINAFTIDTAVTRSLAFQENQFVNNTKVNEAVSGYYDFMSEGNAFLNNQNDTALYLAGAENIKFQNQTVYDQYCNEGLQTYFAEFLKGTVNKETALNNFKEYLNQKCPDIKTK